MNITNLVLLMIVLMSQIQISIQSIRCDYSGGYKQVMGNTQAYVCSLNINDGSQNFVQIEGTHKDTKQDKDVNVLKKSPKFHLNSNKNYLKRFTPIFCEKFSNLESIQLDKVGLEIVDQNSLRNCKNLKRLHFNSNKIQKIDEGLLTENKLLKILWLSKNNLKELAENSFLSQSELQLMDLAYNGLKVLPSNIFKPLLSLIKLNLQHNKIDSDITWMKDLNKLEELDLSYNKFVDLPRQGFYQSNNLKKLSLNNNSIKNLKSGFFKNLVSLEKLLLNSNSIYNIFPQTFFTQSKLKYLWLGGNKLREIHSESFGENVKLKIINLDDNQIYAIDRKVIDNTTIEEINMKNNECSNEDSIRKANMEEKLELCFDNYEPFDEEKKQSLFRQNDFSHYKSLISEKCGQRTMGVPNIMKGENVTRGDYPWVAALTLNNGSFICGGSLLSNKTIITAAHCLRLKNNEAEFYARDIRALVGVYNIKDHIEVGRLSLAIKRIYIHDDWNPNIQTFDGDIAILELEAPVVYNQFIQPICRINPESNIARISKGIIVGYGLDENNYVGEKPKKMSSPIYSRDECIERNKELEPLLSTRAFCGGYKNGTGACTGDSGSGLFVAHDNTFFLRGIVSASMADVESVCNVYNHSVFTDTLKFTSWIELTMLEIHSSSVEDKRFFHSKLKSLKLIY